MNHNDLIHNLIHNQAVAVKRGKHTQAVDAKSTGIQSFNCEERRVDFRIALIVELV